MRTEKLHNCNILQNQLVCRYSCLNINHALHFSCDGGNVFYLMQRRESHTLASRLGASPGSILATHSVCAADKTIPDIAGKASLRLECYTGNSNAAVFGSHEKWTGNDCKGRDRCQEIMRLCSCEYR